MSQNSIPGVFTLLCFLFLNHSIAAEILALDTLLSTGQVSAQFTSMGAYQNECMQVVIQNNSLDSIHGFVEPGRRLNSVNDGEQDILVVKQAAFHLGKFQRDTLVITGFCCESHKSAPSKNAIYTAGAMAPAIWVAIANLISRFNFPPDAIQNAVWVLSDQHDIRSIPAYANPSMDALRHAVADALDLELPWYSFVYSKQEGQLFSGQKTHFFAEVPFSIPQRAVMSPEIVNSKGDVIYRGESVYFSSGDRVFKVLVPIAGWQEEEYDFYLMEDFHTENRKLHFTLK